MVPVPLLFLAAQAVVPTSPRTTVADAAALCGAPLVNGAMVDGGFAPAQHLSRLRISNGSGSSAFVKIIDERKGLIGTMYLANGGQGNVEHIPDGNYRLKFAFGGTLFADCQTLTGTRRTFAFQDTIAFSSTHTVTETLAGTETRWTASDVEVTLHTVPGGQAETEKISLSDFNAD